MARLSPGLAMAAVRGALVAALPPPPQPPPPWQLVETALAALYLIGGGQPRRGPTKRVDPP